MVVEYKKEIDNFIVNRNHFSENESSPDAPNLDSPSVLIKCIISLKYLEKPLLEQYLNLSSVPLFYLLFFLLELVSSSLPNESL